MEAVEVRLLGQLEAVEGGAILPVRGAKQRALLTILALQRGQPVSADRLIDVLWGDGEAANPANALQAQIGQLRRTLGATAIVTSEAGYALGIAPDDLDAARFERLVAEGRRLLAEGETGLASSALGEALRLRRGEPLAEFAYADFANGERAHLAELTLVAIEARAKPTWRWAATGSSSTNWRRCAASTRCASTCGSCLFSPCTGPDVRPRHCAPTAKPTTVWSTSSGSTPAPPSESSRAASWPRTRGSRRRAGVATFAL